MAGDKQRAAQDFEGVASDAYARKCPGGGPWSDRVS